LTNRNFGEDDRRLATSNESAIKSSEFFRNVPKSRRFNALTRRRGLVSAHGIARGGWRTGMQGLAPSDIVLFEDFRLDRRGGLSRRDSVGAFAPVAIGSRGLDILRVLIDRVGEVVSKEEVIAAVWPGTAVEDSNLTVQISALRRVLDRGRSEGSCIHRYLGVGIALLPR
jgi:DNA-binding winged helix-turn-helix (wHTH) protein